MNISADKYGKAENFAIPMATAIQDMNDGDTLVLQNKEYHIYKDFCQSKVIHMTNTDSFKNPQKFFGILLENKNNITVDGNGATLVFHGDMCALAILNCNNVALKNFTIRHNSPANAEMTVKQIKGRTVTYSIPESTLWYTQGKDVVFFEQSPFTKQNYWEFKNDENSHNSVCHSGDDVFRTLHFKSPFAKVKSVEQKSPTELEIKYKSKRKFKIGDVYAFSQNKNRHTCGVFVNESSNVSAENLTVNYLPGFGWLTQMCENVSFTNVTFKADDAHVVSAFADLIHVCGCKGRVDISKCHFENAHDDAINIHGTFLRFKEKKDAKTAVFQFVHRQQGGQKAFFPGDSARLYFRNSLQELGDIMTVAKAVDNIDEKTVTVTFNEELPAKIDSRYLGQANVVIENITYCPDVEISDCVFKAIPTRGVLCTSAGKVRIHNNIFTHCAMAHIFISNDAADWYESGPVRDVEIYSNKFLLQPTKQYEQRSCPGVLIRPIVLGRCITKPIHRNISIYSNYFQVGRDKAVTASGVNGLNIYGNYCDGGKRMSVLKCKNVFKQK